MQETVLQMKHKTTTATDEIRRHTLVPMRMAATCGMAMGQVHRSTGVLDKKIYSVDRETALGAEQDLDHETRPDPCPDKLDTRVA